MKNNKNFKMIQEYLQEKGFVFPNSEIYGRLSNTYDYGPLGTLLFKNIKDLWWNEFITKEPHNYGLEAKTLLNPQVWKASGHLDNFADYVVENKVNQKRYRVDHLIEEFDKKLDVNIMSHEEITQILNEKITNYDNEKTLWGPIRKFNLMFETYQGVIEGQKNKIYLRPELAQGIFTNYQNVKKTMNEKIPFGIGQIGTSFRNEVTPRNFIFRTREFTQMELEYFVNREQSDEKFIYYQQKIENFLKLLGLSKNNYRWREHGNDELAHYAIATTDVEYNFPFGWGEIIGLANRGDFDLKNHFLNKQKKLTEENLQENEESIPYVIEPSIGLDRLMLALLIDAFCVEKEGTNQRQFLKLSFSIAPYQVAILPVVQKLHEDKAKSIFNDLIKKNIRVTYSGNGKIGRRFRLQDQIGTPLIMTIDDQSIEKNIVKIRDRDKKTQIDLEYEKFIQKYLHLLKY